MYKLCLCGSYDDADKIYEYAKIFLKDYIVFTPAFYLGRRPDKEEQNNLIQAHFKRIDISDEIIFIFDTKIGVNTLLEMGYAIAKNKKIVIHINNLIIKDIPNEFTTLFRIMKY